jgi:antiviral helicase SKI2
VKAVSDLNDLNNGVINKKLKLEFFQFGSDFNILDSYEHLQSLKQKLNAATSCTDISNFDKEFAAVFDRKQLEKKLNDLKFQLSHKNLTLYPDYCNKLEVLKELNYIDDMEQGKHTWLVLWLSFLHRFFFCFFSRHEGSRCLSDESK